jgi:hypothetical protein
LIRQTLELNEIGVGGKAGEQFPDDFIAGKQQP